jgi:molybdopterin synthase sulfur carrier subunit
MKVKLLATLRNITGNSEVELEADNVEEVMDILISIYDTDMKDELLEDGELKEEVTVLVNGRNILYLDGVNTLLDENDKVTIFPRVAGG